MKSYRKVLFGVLAGLLVVSVGVACDRLFHEEEMMEEEFEEAIREATYENAEVNREADDMLSQDRRESMIATLDSANTTQAEQQHALDTIAALKAHYSSEVDYYAAMNEAEWKNWDKNGDGIQDWDLDGNGVYDPNVDNTQYNANGGSSIGIMSLGKRDGLVNSLEEAIQGVEALIADLEAKWGLTANPNGAQLAWDGPGSPPPAPTNNTETPEQGPSQYTPGNNTIELIEDK